MPFFQIAEGSRANLVLQIPTTCFPILKHSGAHSPQWQTLWKYMIASTGNGWISTPALQSPHHQGAGGRMENPNGRRSWKRCSPLAGDWKAAATAGRMLWSLRALRVTSTGYPAAARALASFGNRCGAIMSSSVPPATHLPLPPHAVKSGRRGEKRERRFVMDECSSLQEEGRERE